MRSGRSSFVCILLALSSAAAAEERLPFADPRETRVEILREPAGLDPRTEAALRSFVLQREVFGAFHVGPDGFEFGAATGHWTAEDAALVAEVYCSAATGTPCAPLAVVVPADGGRVAIPVWFREDASKIWAQAEPGLFVALAAMPSGAYGFGWEMAAPAEAKATALRECEKRAGPEERDHPADLREPLRKAGAFDCRLIGTVTR
jgi:hypothetical protein